MNSSIPIYVQLRNQIVMGIGHGELKPGESLPTVRQLAEDAGVNTLTVNKTDNLASFTKSDSRLLSEVPIGQKKVSVVTTHPEESYELVTDADKVVLKLLITDPVRFWESSKILIVSYK